MVDVSLNSCFHAVIESWSFCFRVQKGSLMLSGKIMHCEEPKSRGPAASKLLTHFSKPEPNDTPGLAVSFWRDEKLQMRLTFVLLEEVLEMSGSAFIKGSIPRPFFHQQSGVCPPMQIGLYSKEWGEGHPPLLKTQHGICVRPLSEWEAKRARSCFVRSQWIRLL